MATTITSIREALESTIAGTDPTGDAMGAGKFIKLPQKIDWDSVADENKDRGFTVDLIREAEATMFGALSEIDYAATLTVTIGHTKNKRGRAIQDCLDRANTDIGLLRETLEKKTNFPSNVWLIRLNEISQREDENFWYTSLEFRAVYTRTAP